MGPVHGCSRCVWLCMIRMGSWCCTTCWTAVSLMAWGGRQPLTPQGEPRQPQRPSPSTRNTSSTARSTPLHPPPPLEAVQPCHSLHAGVLTSLSSLCNGGMPQIARCMKGVIPKLLASHPSDPRCAEAVKLAEDKLGDLCAGGSHWLKARLSSVSGDTKLSTRGKNMDGQVPPLSLSHPLSMPACLRAYPCVCVCVCVVAGAVGDR